MKLLYLLFFSATVNGIPYHEQEYFETECQCYTVLGFLQERFEDGDGYCKLVRINTT